MHEPKDQEAGKSCQAAVTSIFSLQTLKGSISTCAVGGIGPGGSSDWGRGERDKTKRVCRASDQGAVVCRQKGLVFLHPGGWQGFGLDYLWRPIPALVLYDSVADGRGTGWTNSSVCQYRKG